MGSCGEQAGKVRLLCPWARHLTGQLHSLCWKTGDPEIATPKRVRTYRPKHGDASLSREWKINTANKKKIYIYIFNKARQKHSLRLCQCIIMKQLNVTISRVR